MAESPEDASHRCGLVRLDITCGTGFVEKGVGDRYDIVRVGGVQFSCAGKAGEISGEGCGGGLDREIGRAEVGAESDQGRLVAFERLDRFSADPVESAVENGEDEFVFARRNAVERAKGAAHALRNFRHCDVRDAAAEHPVLEGIQDFALAGRERCLGPP